MPYSPLIDDFTRANEDPLSGGGRWSVLGAATQLKLESNTVTAPVGFLAFSRYRAAVFGPNVRASVRLISGAGDCDLYLLLAIQDGHLSTYDGYHVRLLNSEGSECTVQRVDNGGFTPILSLTPVPVISNGDEFFFQHYNGVLSIGINTQTHGEVYDSTYQIPGEIAVGSAATNTLDDVRAGTIASEIIVPNMQGIRVGL